MRSRPTPGRPEMRPRAGLRQATESSRSASAAGAVAFGLWLASMAWKLQAGSWRKRSRVLPSFASSRGTIDCLGVRKLEAGHAGAEDCRPMLDEASLGVSANCRKSWTRRTRSETRTASLFGEINSLLIRRNFPVCPKVYCHRESFHIIGLTVLLREETLELGPRAASFPVFSLQNRESGCQRRGRVRLRPPPITGLTGCQ